MQAEEAKLVVLPAGTPTPLVGNLINDSGGAAIAEAASVVETVDPKDTPTIEKVADAAHQVEGALSALPVHATAWSVAPTAYVVSPYDKKLFPRARVAHEIEHMTQDDFKTNAQHHIWFHFCGRVGHGFRLFGKLHLSQASWDQAGRLLGL